MILATHILCKITDSVCCEIICIKQLAHSLPINDSCNYFLGYCVFGVLFIFSVSNFMDFSF